MTKEQKKMLTDLMALDFTLLELNLYLDTHPDDRKALSDYAVTLQQSQQLRNKYEKEYGPLTASSQYAMGSTFKWVEEPWPWQENFA